jgi:2-iminobutanoate/2-iminopropanoate deaminase
MKKIINTVNAPTPLGPYSQAILTGDTLYISGQIAIEPLTGKFICSEISDETNQVMKNLLAILKEANMTFENVVKCSIFVKNMEQFATINEAYGNHFRENAPTRETVEVSRLPKDVNIEISCIAVS